MAEPVTAEYCFLGLQHWSTCMTKGEWSGWAQAVGSILALALTLGLWWSSRYASYRQASGQLKIFMHASSGAYFHFIEAAANGDGKRLRQQADFLRGALDLASTISIVDLRAYLEVMKLIELRAIAEQCIERARFMASDDSLKADSSNATFFIEAATTVWDAFCTLDFRELEPVSNAMQKYILDSRERYG